METPSDRLACGYGCHPFELLDDPGPPLMRCTRCGATYFALPWQVEALLGERLGKQGWRSRLRRWLCR